MDCWGPGNTRHLGEPVARTGGNMVIIEFFPPASGCSVSVGIVQGGGWHRHLDHGYLGNARYPWVLATIVTRNMVLLEFL